LKWPKSSRPELGSGTNLPTADPSMVNNTLLSITRLDERGRRPYANLNGAKPRHHTCKNKSRQLSLTA
jgi:hypothetical protein